MGRIKFNRRTIMKKSAKTIKTENKDFQWVCNECNFPNLTGAVPEEDIKLGRHSCVMCGCVEMHKEEIKKEK